MAKIDELKRQFLEHVEIEKGNSLKTVRNYEYYLTRFFAFGNISDTGDITDEKIREFRLFLNRQSGVKVKGQVAATLKKNTQNYHLIALRVFLKYLMKRDIKALSPERIELAKVKQRSLDIITPAELKRLLDAPDTNTPIGLRDKAILELLFKLFKF